ncbi:MAG: sigma-70 family RNA polymerase sigma factor [Planctomycetota bacterium]
MEDDGPPPRPSERACTRRPQALSAAPYPPADRKTAPVPRESDDHDLWLQARTLGLDPSVREKLISRYLPLVRIAAHRMAMLSTHSHDNVEDCHGSGAVALVKAVDAFDPTRGVPFEAFAYPRIYGAMIDHVRAQDWVPRGVRLAVQRLREAYDRLSGEIGRPPHDEELAAHLSLSIREYGSLVQRAVPALILPLEALDQAACGHPSGGTVPDVNGSPSARLEHQELVDLVSEAMAGLSETERAVINAHYNEGLMFKEVAKNLRRSRARISQLHTGALSKLRSRVSRALEPRTSAPAAGGVEQG